MFLWWHAWYSGSNPPFQNWFCGNNEETKNYSYKERVSGPKPPAAALQNVSHRWVWLTTGPTTIGELAVDAARDTKIGGSGRILPGITVGGRRWFATGLPHCGGVHPHGPLLCVSLFSTAFAIRKIFRVSKWCLENYATTWAETHHKGLSSCEASVFKFRQKMKCLRNLVLSFAVYELMMIHSVVFMFHSHRCAVTSNRPQ